MGRTFSTLLVSQPSNDPVSSEQMKQQLERVLHSKTFRNAPVLHKLLDFIGSKSLEGLSGDIKEYTIGTEVLGRSADFDPHIDTVVRVHVHRVREKLEEYYRVEGMADAIALEIPKGHYVASFSRRTASTPIALGAAQLSGLFHEEAVGGQEGLTPQPAAGGGLSGLTAPRNWAWRWGLPILAGAILLAGAIYLFARLGSDARGRGQGLEQPIKPTAGTEGDAILSTLWAGFLKDQSPPIVAYSNSVFLATETSDLLRLKDEDVDNLGASAQSNIARRLVANPRLLERAGPVYFEDVYTGTGEVMAVFYLTRMFTHFQSSIQVERSRLVSIDDISRHPLIFLGSTREDALLAGLPLTQDFEFNWSQKPEGVWNGRILNLHPQPGEQPYYEVERDPKTGVLRADYALVSFLPGVSPNRRIAILGGLTTLGTQGAADFATSPAGVSEMFSRLGGEAPSSASKPPGFFQAVLRVEIMKDEVLRVRCVAAHEIHASLTVTPKR